MALQAPAAQELRQDAGIGPKGPTLWQVGHRRLLNRVRPS